MVAYKEKIIRKIDINLMKEGKGIKEKCLCACFKYSVSLPPLILILLYTVAYAFLSFPVYHFHKQRKS